MTNVTHEQGHASPASLNRVFASTYTHIPTGKVYIQKKFPQGNVWEEDAIEEIEEILPTTKVYRAIIRQSETNPPVIVEVLENTYGADASFRRLGVGDYRLDLVGMVTDKTTVIGTPTFTQYNGLGGTVNVHYAIDYNFSDTDELYIKSWNALSGSLGFKSLVDGAMPWDTYIHIETKI